jgi:hypothetical protein
LRIKNFWDIHTKITPKTRIMKRCALILIPILILTANPILSQDIKDTVYRNTVKANLASAAFRKVTLGYEYYFNDRWSAQLEAGYKFGGKIPKFIGLGEFAVASETGGLKGFSVSSSARYHFGNCDCGDRTGLYGGIYLNNTRLWGDLSFHYWNGENYIDVGGAGDLQEYGIGLQLGYQFVFKKRFLVDLMFMGPRTSFQRLKLELDSQFAEDVIPLIEDEINKRLDWYGIEPISISPDASAVVDFRFNNFRYAISFGFLF